MKKIIIIYISLCFNFIVEAVNVYVNEPGTLKSIALLSNKSFITDLTLTGILDARDFKFIRDSLINLERLDISENKYKCI